MEIDGSELAIRQEKGDVSSATITPQIKTPTPPPPPQNNSSPPQKVTLVAADELREDQSWKPTPYHPGPSFKSLEWSADGTAIIASTTSKTILSYVLPTNLLESEHHDDTSDASSSSASPSPSTPSQSHHKSHHHSIKPQGRLEFGTTPLSFAAAPYFSLATPWTQTVLVGCPDKPIQLFPLFPGNEDGISSEKTTTPTPIATYSLIKHETEAYMPPMSLSWTTPGSHFVVGTNNLLALFDVSRIGSDPPVLRVPTTSSLFSGAMYGLGISGNVSALAATPAHNLTAAGTWTRGVGLYDLSRGGDLASHWNLRDNDTNSSAYNGGGVIQLQWSPCGRYLVVNERKSNGLLVYDVRGTHRLLATLTGRRNDTARPIRCTVYGSASASSDDSENNTFELWSGTDDGSIVMYENIGKTEGDIEPTFRYQAHDKGISVASTLMHNSGYVLATCSTSSPVDFKDSDSESESESESGSDSDSSSDSEDGDEEEENSSSVKDSGRDDEAGDDEIEDDSSDSNDDSESSDSDESTSLSATRPPRPRMSDPSLKIWSLVPLQSPGSV